MQYSHWLFDWPSFAVTGSEAASWLNGLVTCDVASLEANSSLMGLLLTKQGKARGYLHIVGRADSIEVGVAGGDREAILTSLDDHLVMEDAEISPVDGLVWALLIGDNPVETGSSWGLETYWAEWAGTDCALVVLRPPHVDEQLGELRAQSRLLAPEEWTAARIARGIPEYGRDFGANDNPHQAALDRRAVNWEKGCYLGQEVVCMQDMRGKVKRRLARLSTPTPIDWAAVKEVMAEDGHSVGHVTSAQGTLALAMLKAPYYEPGTRLSAGGHEVVVEAGP